jgi:hypothetical protein
MIIMTEKPDFPSTFIFVESIMYTIFCAFVYPNLILCAISSVLLVLAFSAHIWVYKIHIDKYEETNDNIA